MGDPNTLVAFVQWATATYPANHYALILWDHGNGWRSRALDDPVTQGIAYGRHQDGDVVTMTSCAVPSTPSPAAGPTPSNSSAWTPA